MASPHEQVDPYQKGDTLAVCHVGGNVSTATFDSVDPTGSTAILIFKMAGERKVRVTDTKTMRKGEFTSKMMRAWFLDPGTIDRIVATHRVEEAMRKAKLAKERGR